MQCICLFEHQIRGLFNGGAMDACDVRVGWFRKSEQPQVCLHACGKPKILADDAAPLQRATAKLWLWWEFQFCMCFITSCALHHLHMQIGGWRSAREAWRMWTVWKVCRLRSSVSYSPVRSRECQHGQRPHVWFCIRASAWSGIEHESSNTWRQRWWRVVLLPVSRYKAGFPLSLFCLGKTISHILYAISLAPAWEDTQEPPLSTPHYSILPSRSRSSLILLSRTPCYCV